MRTTMVAVAMLSLGLMSPACAQQLSREDIMKIRQSMTDEFAAAVAKKDVAAMADHYTADAVTANLCPETPPVVWHEAQVRRFEALLKVEWGPADDVALAPKHPYTQALFAAALPVAVDTPPAAMPLAGEVPSPLAPPAGYRFHPRCPHAMARCATDEPALRTESDRLAACHLYPIEKAHL